MKNRFVYRFLEITRFGIENTSGEVLNRSILALRSFWSLHFSENINFWSQNLLGCWSSLIAQCCFVYTALYMHNTFQDLLHDLYIQIYIYIYIYICIVSLQFVLQLYPMQEQSRAGQARKGMAGQARQGRQGGQGRQGRQCRQGRQGRQGRAGAGRAGQPEKAKQARQASLWMACPKHRVTQLCLWHSEQLFLKPIISGCGRRRLLKENLGSPSFSGKTGRQSGQPGSAGSAAREGSARH